jgi:hypothetical protein
MVGDPSPFLPRREKGGMKTRPASIYFFPIRPRILDSALGPIAKGLQEVIVLAAAEKQEFEPPLFLSQNSRVGFLLKPPIVKKCQLNVIFKHAFQSQQENSIIL